MADTREVLALVTPHGVDPTKPRGGKPVITGLDVSAALAMGNLSPGQTALLLVKYCGEDRLRHLLWSYWFQTVMKHAVINDWRERRRPGQPSRLQLLVSYSLNEFLDDLLCDICEGIGSVPLSSKILTCRECEGTGRMYPSQRAIAKELQIDESTFRQTWSTRLAWCRYKLMVWELDGVHRVAGKI